MVKNHELFNTGEEMEEVDGILYPKEIVDRAKRLLKRAGHEDLGRMLMSLVIVRENLQHAVPASPDEPVRIQFGSIAIVLTESIDASPEQIKTGLWGRFRSLLHVR